MVTQGEVLKVHYLPVLEEEEASVFFQKIELFIFVFTFSPHQWCCVWCLVT